MSDGYGVQHAEMAKGAGVVDQARNDLVHLTDSAFEEATTLLGTWKGNASASFASAHLEWDAEQKKMLDALGRVHDALTGAHKDYVNTEESEEQPYSHLRALINP